MDKGQGSYMVETMDIMQVMKFDSEAKITRMDWWIGGIVLGVLNAVLGMVVPASAAMVVSLIVMVPARFVGCSTT